MQVLVETKDVGCVEKNRIPSHLSWQGAAHLAQTEYLERHNHDLNFLCFEELRSLNLTNESSPWYSPIKPKPVYENEQAVAYWDVPLFAEHTTVVANRIDVTVVDKVRKKVLLIEMTCPWVESREKKSTEKTSKYGPLRWELQMRNPGYCIKQIQHSHRRPGWVF